MNGELDQLAHEIRLGVDQRKVDWSDLVGRSEQLLQRAREGDAEDVANRAWFLNTVATLRDDFTVCFAKMRSEKYYDAWCRLEQVELGLLALKANPFLDVGNYSVNQLLDLVQNWQQLFPYKIFLSPEMIVRKRVCSICDTVLNPWSSCDHIPNRVYHGRRCFRRASDVEMLGISLVTNPVQKYSVAFLRGEDGTEEDHYDYSLVKFVLVRLMSPFDAWFVQWTTAYHPHHLFKKFDSTDACPCGSGRTYGGCCLTQPGVMRPHAQVTFERNPPSHLPTGELVGYGAAGGPATLMGLGQL